MKERPILFSGPMVRAILEGRKTQTRRVCKDQAYFERCGYKPDEAHVTYSCPYGKVGDRLWVRETACYQAYYFENSDVLQGRAWLYKADLDSCGQCPVKIGFTEKDCLWVTPKEKWRPSIHLPRHASRIKLQITDVRVEKVQRISNRDARSEGVRGNDLSGDGGGCDYRFPFQQLWDSINAKRGFGWEVNPWVWAITFKRVL